MKKLGMLSAATLLMMSVSNAALATDFVGKIKNYYIKDNGMVLLSIENASGSVPNCNTSTNEHWPFYFFIDTAVKEKMFDMLLHAEKKDVAVYVGHEESANRRCKVSYIAVIK